MRELVVLTTSYFCGTARSEFKFKVKLYLQTTFMFYAFALLSAVLLNYSDVFSFFAVVLFFRGKLAPTLTFLTLDECELRMRQ